LTGDTGAWASETLIATNTFTWTALTMGQSYDFKILANNKHGSSVDSSPQISIKAAGVPDTMTAPTV